MKTKVLLVAISVLLIQSCYQGRTPKRLSNIPENTVWKGDADEGFWFDLISIDSVKKKYRIKIYNDYDGGLVMDTNFKSQNNYPFDRSILDSIAYFEFDKIVMMNNGILNIDK